MGLVRVPIADDRPHFRGGLRALLHSAPDPGVVCETGDRDKAMPRAAELRPDVILTDVNMPGMA